MINQLLFVNTTAHIIHYIYIYIYIYPGLRQQPATAQTFWLPDKSFTPFGCVFAYLCVFAAGICADGCGRPAQGSSCKLLNATAESVGHFGSKLGDLGTQNPSKMLSKCSQNRPKITPKWVLEAVLGPLGASWGHLGAILGPNRRSTIR